MHTIAAAENYISTRMLPQYERLGYGNYTIIKKEANTKVGTVGLYDRPGMQGIDLGFALLPQHENNGFAFEAADRMIKLATSTFNIKLLKAITTTKNTKSQNLINKLGFTFKENIYLPNDPEELMCFELIPK